MRDFTHRHPIKLNSSTLPDVSTAVIKIATGRGQAASRS